MQTGGSETGSPGDCRQRGLTVPGALLPRALLCAIDIGDRAARQCMVLGLKLTSLA